MIQVTDASEIAEFRTRTVGINEALLKSGLRMHELMEESRRLSAGLLESAAQEREARREAQAANHSKDIFLATLSHEMRTPLNAILGWAVLLRMQRAQNGQPIDADLDQGLAVIERNARAQGKLIEDVLDVARVVSGKFQLNLQQCDLDVIAFAATATMRPAASAKRIALNVVVEPEASLGSFKLMADAARLHQAVLNLLSNAVKFSHPGGEVRVGLERDGERGMARVVVSDSGKGIRADFLPLIFDRFTQAAEGSTRSFGGLGLGLTIVRHIAELHGGTVVAQSEGEGRGATFTLELPTQVPLTALEVHAELLTEVDVAELLRTVSYVPAFRLDDLRVLVVDDEEDARTVAQRALESAGATVVTASSAEEGFQFAIRTNAPPHVLVSDVAMPGEDGYSLIRRLRSAGANADQLPAVALTAYAGADERSRALSEGFQVHLPKPLDLQELIAAVGTLAGRSRL
jgi:signal transduction histidine kinase/ActR/RegA family two-component response regulator